MVERGGSLLRIMSGWAQEPRSMQSYTHLCCGTSLLASLWRVYCGNKKTNRQLGVEDNCNSIITKLWFAVLFFQTANILLSADGSAVNIYCFLVAGVTCWLIRGMIKNPGVNICPQRNNRKWTEGLSSCFEQNEPQKVNVCALCWKTMR